MGVQLFVPSVIKMMILLIVVAFELSALDA